MRLTVGVVSQNGMPLLTKCLQSLPDLAGAAGEVDFILVDSASSDGTLEAMVEFAQNRAGVRVYSMRGSVNLAATRNVVLAHSRPGAVFLVDGDIVVNQDFVVSAMSELKRGTCEIVSGRLPEIVVDEHHNPISQIADRYCKLPIGYINRFGGIVVFGPAVMRSGIRYDEGLRRCEDVDLSIQLNNNFRILSLDVPIGTHYSVPYLSRARIAKWYRELYPMPAGKLLRKHLLKPRQLWLMRDSFSGAVAGFMLQSALIAAIISQSVVAIGIVGGLFLADLIQFALRRPIREYLEGRIVVAWITAYGFLFPEKTSLSYEVLQRYP